MTKKEAEIIDEAFGTIAEELEKARKSEEHESSKRGDSMV